MCSQAGSVCVCARVLRLLPQLCRELGRYAEADVVHGRILNIASPSDTTLTSSCLVRVREPGHCAAPCISWLWLAYSSRDRGGDREAEASRLDGGAGWGPVPSLLP